jgi:mRNA interferase HicA
MKRTELIRLLTENGWQFEREGGRHTVYVKDGKTEEIPRHREINERLAKSVIKRNGLNKP